MIIRQLREEDIDVVLRINADAAPHVAKLDATELRRLVAIADTACVAEEATNVIGYLLAMSDSCDYEGEEFRHFRGLIEQPFLYIDQITVDREARRMQIASKLYEHLVQRGRRLDIRLLCCEVNVRPANPISLWFHERLGFEKVCELETADGRTVRLLCKRISIDFGGRHAHILS